MPEFLVIASEFNNENIVAALHTHVLVSTLQPWLHVQVGKAVAQADAVEEAALAALI